MSQFNCNRLWIFESPYETESILYKGHAASAARPEPMGELSVPVADLVGAEVTRLDGLERANN